MKGFFFSFFCSNLLPTHPWASGAAAERLVKKATVRASFMIAEETDVLLRLKRIGWIR